MKLLRRLFRRFAAVAIFALCLSQYARAQGGVVTSGDTSVPEMDASMVGAGVALLGGVTLIVRSRRKP